MTSRLQPARVSIIGLLALLPLASVQAATIQGRVDLADSGGAHGVKVLVPGTSLTAVTDRSGFYSIAGVSTGEYTVKFDYVGSPAVEKTVSVPSADSVVTADATIAGDAVQLEGYTVNAYATGTARAVNLQRTSDNLREVVASDRFGQFPDGNAAEALNRLPGVSVERDQGEGRFVVVRGIDPNLNAVSLDGLALASPSADDRKTLLDTLPLEVLDNIEVSKTVLPSQPGDAIGGYIELSSPSAFDHDGLTARASAALLYADLTDEFGHEFSASIGNRFGKDKQWGLVLSVVQSRRDFGSDNVEAAEWDTETSTLDGNDYLVTDEFAYRDYNLTRERLGVNASLEFRPDDANRYFFRAGYNEYRDAEVRQAATFDLGDTLDNGTFTGLGNGIQADDVVIAREVKIREEFMRLAVFSAGGEHRPGDWTIDYSAGISLAEEDTPSDFSAVYELNGPASVDFNGVSGRNPRATQTGGPALNNAANYDFDEIEQSKGLAKERDYTGKLNLRRDLSGDLFRYVKFGGLGRFKKKENDAETLVSGANPAAVDTLDAFEKNNLRDFLGSNVPGISQALENFFKQNRGAFALARDDEASSVEDYTTHENVFAGYFMNEARIGDLSIITGARVEHTDFRTKGFSFADGTGVVTPTQEFDKAYTNVLPGVHLRYSPDQRLVLRASWTNTIARPTFAQSSPGRIVDFGNEEERGNPDLDPYESMNWDFSAQYYHDTLGIFSAAVFYKDIENFIYSRNTPGAGAGGGDLITFQNGPSGSILGLELAYQRKIDFIPGLSFSASGTWSDGKATVLGETPADADRDLDFVKQSDFIGQLALSYETKRFFARLGYTYRSDFLDEVGSEALADRYLDSNAQLDFYSSFALTRSLKVYIELNNLTNEPLEAYWGDSNRLSQYEEYGVSGAVGIKWQY
jgi:TonB-dependent receptor